MTSSATLASGDLPGFKKFSVKARLRPSGDQADVETVPRAGLTSGMGFPPVGGIAQIVPSRPNAISGAFNSSASFDPQPLTVEPTLLRSNAAMASAGNPLRLLTRACMSDYGPRTQRFHCGGAPV